MACGSSDENNADRTPPGDTLQRTSPAANVEAPTTQNQVTGVLRTSGLQPDEAKALGLSTDNYQVISQMAYFIEGPDSLEAYLGKCLKLVGTMVAEEQENASGRQHEQTTYGRKRFIVEGIEVQPNSLCYYSDTTQRHPQGREVAYTGFVERMQRPAPDIAYDYQLRLQKPYRDANNPYQPGKLVQSLPLGSADFEVLNTLEDAYRQKNRLRIQGVQYQGYAESEAVWVLAADSLAL